MENREEIIKAFVNDKEKVQAIANDEQFVNTVSEGKATPETYKEEFKKFGLVLSDEEATQVADMINEIHDTPPEKLNDLSLNNIVGGNYDPNDNLAIQQELDAEKRDRRWRVAGFTGAYIGGGIALAGVLAVVIGLECGKFANGMALSGIRARNRGNYQLASKYFTHAKNLAWMFPKQKAHYEECLKALPKQ